MYDDKPMMEAIISETSKLFRPGGKDAPVELVLGMSMHPLVVRDLIRARGSPLGCLLPVDDERADARVHTQAPPPTPQRFMESHRLSFVVAHLL